MARLTLLTYPPQSPIKGFETIGFRETLVSEGSTLGGPAIKQGVLKAHWG